MCGCCSGEQPRTVRRMVGRKIVEVEVPNLKDVSKNTKNYVVALHGQEETFRVTAHEYREDEHVYQFFLDGEKIASIPSCNVLYVWREDD